MVKNEIEFVGKCLLIDKKILVIGDLHLGFGEALRESGVMLPVDIFEDVIRDLDLIFGRVGGVEKVVVLGDIKHEFGKVMMDEWKEVGEIMNYLRRKSKEVVVVKGNHDAIAGSIVEGLERVSFVDYYLLGDLVFLHGDRDFPEIHGRGVRVWIMGHGHPAIVLEDDVGVKKEKYKCFLEGKFKGKSIIIVPSFSSVNEGTDVLGDWSLGFAWDFNLKKFDVRVVGDGLSVLGFGKLGKI